VPFTEGAHELERAASEWLGTVLSPLHANRAWEAIVKTGVGYPRIVYQLVYSNPMKVVNGVVIFAEQLWQVEAVGYGADATPAENLRDLAHPQLHRKSWVVLPRSCQLIDSEFVRPIRRDILESGTGSIFRYRGGEYRLKVMKQQP
jgi:hypothetical protein